jgi:hypothetical protein
VHSGEGRPASAPVALPLRVADPAAYAREKQRAAQLAGANAPLSAAGALGSRSASAAPSAPAAAVFGSLNAAGLSASQQIATFGKTANVTPPDTTGAIGPEHYVEFVNEEVAAYQRANLAIVGKPVALSTFTGGVAACDPQIKYDPQSSRWFYAAIRCDGTTTQNALYLGFSKTSDPTDFSTAVGHGWCGYSYGTGEVLEDYPKLGLDTLHIIIGSNSFNARTEAFLTAHILSLPKPGSGTIETCPAAPKLTTFGSPLRTSVENHIATTPEPATVADESPSGFVVAADAVSGNGSHLMIWQVAGTAEKPELTALGAPAATAFQSPPNVPQPGSSDELDSFDSRLTQAVAAADPSAGGAEAVWTQHTIAGGAGSVVRWYELLPGKLEVRQAGTISDTSRFVFNGAIAPTRSGGAVINYNTASSTALVQIMAQSRVGSDPAGTMTTPIALASSAAIDSDFSCPSVQPRSTACRWGDYAGASVDPTNTNVVWGSNQVNGPAGTEHPAQWATQNFALTPLPNPPTVVTEAASAVTQTSATLHASVNPNGGEVSECKFEYGTTTAYGSSVSCSKLPGSGTSPVQVSASVAGLSPNTIYHFRISATNAGGTSKGSDEGFTTLPPPPTVATERASSVTQTSATLNGKVNPNGSEVKECKFEYGTSTAYGSSAPCAPAPGSGTSPVAVSAAASGLSARTTYHFRVSATNAGGTSTGSDRTFSTATPHYYSEGVLVGSEPKASVDWGTIRLTSAKGGITGSFVTCHSVGAGTLLNPGGGGAGEGLTQAFATFDCESQGVCAAGQSTALVAEELPWHSILTEEALGTIRQETTGIRLLIECVVGGKLEGGSELVTGAGEKGLRPVSRVGTSALHPGFFEYGEGSGELEVEGSGGTVTRRAEGAVKILGFDAQELITFKNP